MKTFMVICFVLAVAKTEPVQNVNASSPENCFKENSKDANVQDEVGRLEQAVQDYNSSGQTDLYQLYDDTTSFLQEVLYSVEDCQIQGLPTGDNLTDLIDSKSRDCVVEKAEQTNATKSFIVSLEDLINSYQADNNTIDPVEFAKVLYATSLTFFQLEKDECEVDERCLNDGVGNLPYLNDTECFAINSGDAAVNETIEHLKEDIMEINKTGNVDLDHLYEDVVEILEEVFYSVENCDLFISGEQFSDYLDSKNATCVIEKAAESNKTEVFTDAIKDFVQSYYEQNNQLNLEAFSKFVDASGSFFFNIKYEECLNPDAFNDGDGLVHGDDGYPKLYIYTKVSVEVGYLISEAKK